MCTNPIRATATANEYIFNYHAYRVHLYNVNMSHLVWCDSAFNRTNTFTNVHLAKMLTSKREGSICVFILGTKKCCLKLQRKFVNEVEKFNLETSPRIKLN